MRGPIVGGLVFVSLAAAAFACGSSDNNSSSSTADAGVDSSYVYTPVNPGSTYDASTSTFTTTYGGCSVFPLASAWNTDVTTAAVDTTLTTQLTDSFGTGNTIHLNFGRTDYGRGYIVTTGTAATTQLAITLNDDLARTQSDKIACPAGTTGDTCYPIPTSAKVSDNGKLIFLDTTGTPSNCTVYELLNPSTDRDGALRTEQDVDFASVWKLNSAALKTDQFRAVSASGTSIFAGLLKREDITKGTLTHALRATMPTKNIRQSFVHPATWSDSTSSDTTRFPMGTRLRLKAAIAETSYTGDALILIRGLKKYGVILADHNDTSQVSSSASLSIDGEVNDGWVMDDSTNGLNDKIADVIQITDFEVVNTGVAVAATSN